MKKETKRRVIIWLNLLMLCMILCPAFHGGGRYVSAEAAKKDEKTALAPYSKTTDGYTEQNGITVTTVFDKSSYKSGETAQVTMELKNTNNYDVSEVKVQYKLPDNFNVTDGKKSENIETLAAGETKKLSFKATVTEDTNAPLVKGAYTIYIVLGVCAVVLILAVIVLFLKKKKMGKKTLSMFLVLVLAVNGCFYAIPEMVSAKDTDEQTSSEETQSSAEPTTETGNYEVPLEAYFSRTSVHDPSVVKDPESGMYYIFGSHLAFSKSENLIEWTNFTTNIQTDYAELFKEPWDEWAAKATPNSGLGGMMWAPDVIWNETMQKWCMYMSINGDNWVSSICLLTADNIEGPYEYKGIVVYSGINNPNKKVDEKKTDIYKVLGEGADLSRYASTAYSCINAIDPNVQYDDNGDLYMTYGSWSAGIFQLKLDTKTGLRDYNTTYETKRDESDAYLGVKIAGGYYSSGEGPYLLKAGGYYYLFLSYAALEAMGGYQMRIYRSENIAGPYVDENGVSAIRPKGEDVKLTNYGLRIFSSYDMYGLSTVQVAQGHNSAIVDDDGKIFLVYHTRFQSDTGTNEMHQVRVHQMFINDDGWLVAAPYEYTGETISDAGYAMEDMAGTYEFIYHEPTSYYKVVGDLQTGIVGRGRKGKKMQLTKDVTIGKHISTLSCEINFVQNNADTITLNEDGTITGTYQGKWSHDKEKVTIDLGNGNVYKGVFLKQANENTHSMTMTFTVEGKNVTVWGIKPLVEDETE